MRSLKLNTNTESVLHAMLFSVFILIVHYTMGVACQSKRPSTCDLVGRERERERKLLSFLEQHPNILMNQGIIYSYIYIYILFYSPRMYVPYIMNIFAGGQTRTYVLCGHQPPRQSLSSNIIFYAGLLHILPYRSINRASLKHLCTDPISPIIWPHTL